MRKTIEIVTCDIKDCESQEEMKGQFIDPSLEVQVVFTTEQTEGRSCEPYPQLCKIDLCPKCKKHWLYGHPVFAQGAMGYNTYYFKS